MRRATILFVMAIAAALSGCATQPAINNLSGKPISFNRPVLDTGTLKDATFVLLEKGVKDNVWRVVSISKTRQNMTNDRQERVAFNKELTLYAPDFTSYQFSKKSSNSSSVMTCTDVYAPRVREYSPCNSEFGRVYIPAETPMPSPDWMKDPSRNPRRIVISPVNVLKQAGVFDRLSELVAPQ